MTDPGPDLGEPPDEPSADEGDQRRWIILAVLAAVAVALLLFLLLRGDDDGDSASTTTTESSTTTSTSSTTTSSTTTTTAPTTSTTIATTTTATATTIDPARCVSSAADDPDPTALVVHEAWVAGDQTCAGNLMTSEALARLFSRPGAGSTEAFQGCNDDGTPDQTTCSFTYEGGATSYRMAYTDTEGWTVFEVSQVAD